MNKIYPTSKISDQSHAVSAHKLRSPSRKRNGECWREYTASNKHHLVAPQGKIKI